MSTINTSDQPTQRRFTGYHMILVMVLFFGTIITVNLTMAWFATHSWTGLVVKNSYVASQHFNETTAEKRAQIALDWQATLDFTADTLTIKMAQASGAAIENAIVTAAVGRPAHEQLDRTLQLAEKAAGTYIATEQLEAGIWQADVTVTDANGVIWTKSYRFIAKE